MLESSEPDILAGLMPSHNTPEGNTHSLIAGFPNEGTGLPAKRPASTPPYPADNSQPRPFL
jgi:hypothetical protein